MIDSPDTIAVLPFFAGGRFPTTNSIGRCRAGGVDYTSGRELIDVVRDLSLGLSAIGMARGDRVALMSESRPEWVFTDLAVLAAGGVTTPIYTTLSVEQTEFILRDSEAGLAVVSTVTQLAKVLAIADGLPLLRAVVLIEPTDGPLPASRIPVHTYRDVVQQGHGRLLGGWGIGREFHDDARKVVPGDLATIIYTSGTTAEPKGVCLTHGNLAANLRDLRQILSLTDEDVALSFLPLSHAFERMVSYVYLATGVPMVFAESLDTVDRDLKVVRPTVMTGVPRVFEKLYEKVLAKGRESTGLSRRVFDWAVTVANARGRLLPEGRPLSLALRIQSAIVDGRVFGLVRAAVGGRMRYAVSGSAPLRPDIMRFFYGLGIPILEGYGLTETSPVLSVMPLDKIRFGSVGPTLPSVQMRIADDGEILVRGPSVTTGYHRRPDETAQAFRDGWFHTGDLGAIDAEGYLHLTGRKKDLLVTSGGKKIAPQPIETAARTHALVAEAVLIAEARRFPALLLVPDFAALCRELGMARPTDPSALQAVLARADVVARFQQVVDAVNETLAQFERVKKFAILPQEFKTETGELTPTLKVRRKVVEVRYRDVIEGMYR